MKLPNSEDSESGRLPMCPTFDSRNSRTCSCPLAVRYPKVSPVVESRENEIDGRGLEVSQTWLPRCEMKKQLLRKRDRFSS